MTPGHGAELSYILRTGRSETGQTVTEAQEKGPTFQPSLETTLLLHLSMDQPPISQAREKTYLCAPIVLPSLVIGNFGPNELAIIFTLQAYGANFEWREVSLANLIRATRIAKGSIPRVISRLEKEGIVQKEKYRDEETGEVVYAFKLNIWGWADIHSK